jgi:hypothetical protein
MQIKLTEHNNLLKLVQDVKREARISLLLLSTYSLQKHTTFSCKEIIGFRQILYFQTTVNSIVQRHLLTFLKLSSPLSPLFSPSNSYPFHPPYPISLYLFSFVTERRAVAVVVMATK